MIPATKTAIVTRYRRPRSDAARAPSIALRSPLALARRSRKVWNDRAATHETAAAAYPRAGRLAAIQIGSATASAIRSMLRRTRMPTPVSDVLKACVDKPESQEEAGESAHECERDCCAGQ